MSVGEICDREVVIVRAVESLPEAARLMREYHVGDLVVVSEDQSRGVPVGILSDRDMVVKMVAKDLPYAAVTVGDLMSTDLVTAREADSAFDTIKRMREHGVRRLPVLDEGGALVGILAVDDLIDLVAEQLDDLLRPYYTGSFWGLLNPFGLLSGVVSLAVLTLHGAIWLQLRTQESIALRAKVWVQWTGVATIAGFALAGVWLAFGVCNVMWYESEQFEGEAADEA